MLVESQKRLLLRDPVCLSCALQENKRMSRKVLGVNEEDTKKARDKTEETHTHAHSHTHLKLQEKRRCAEQSVR